MSFCKRIAMDYIYLGLTRMQARISRAMAECDADVPEDWASNLAQVEAADSMLRFND